MRQTKKINSNTVFNTVPPCRGRAVKLSPGQGLKIINTYGKQVADTWCFYANDIKEFISMEQNRAVTQNLFSAKGDLLNSNRRRPTLQQKLIPHLDAVTH